MRRYILFFYILLILIIIIIPIIFIDKIQIYMIGKNEENILKEEKSGQTIQVYIKTKDEVIAMDMNDYLKGVLTSEMPPTYELEALKAQATVARTYTYQKIKYDRGNKEHKGADICSDYKHCQAFHTKEEIMTIWRNKGYSESDIYSNWRKVSEAVENTQGYVILYNNDYIKAFFHADSGGKTESSDQIWGKEPLPYLVSVESRGEESHPFYNSKVTLETKQFEDLVKDKINKDYIYSKDKIKILSYTTSGRVDQIKIGSNIVDATNLRTIFNLKSTMFNVIATEKNITFNVTGYGHGLGMSQVGANYMALQKYNFIDIIKHYYKGVTVTKYSN